jgi:hypothetical protein
MEDLSERRQAELDFVAAAYSEDEAWCTETEGLGSLLPSVYRRLEHESSSANANASGSHSDRFIVSFLLQLEMTASYPIAAALKVSGTVQEDRTSSRLVKSAFNALPALLLSCRQTADDYSQNAEEAVFAVLSQADEWIQNEWPAYAVTASSDTQSTLGQNVPSSLSSSNPNANNTHSQASSSSSTIILGRRLIYSHHIISKTKRQDMRNLASFYKLTGYVKIGWPGIVILEGRDDDCNAFYDDMRKWAWKYLVVRGEMQERVLGGGDNHSTSVDSKRLFPTFLETDDMSIVANHCREVGLESLFRTSMKVYANGGLKNGKAGDDDHDQEHDYDYDAQLRVYGALVHVDHMRDAKSYRKWLRKTCSDADVSLLIKQCYPNLDFTKRPKIIVGLLGDRESISSVLKRWRTTRVDVDSKGQACLERMMSVILEGNLDHHPSESIDWDATHADESVNTAQEQLVELIESIGGPSWADAIREL